MSEGKYATAEEAIVDSLDRAQRCLDRMFDPARDKVDHTAILSLINHFNTVVLLEALRRKDPAEADRITHWLDDIHEDGSTAGELIWQWRDQVAKGHPLTGIGPAGTEPAPPADAYPFQLQHREDGPPMEVLAAPTGVPGLVITQALAGGGELGEYSVSPGRWNITHAGSGRIIAGASYPLDVAHRIVERVGALAVDWTRSAENLGHDDNGIRAGMRDAFHAFGDCRYCSDADHVPVAPWRATPSTEAGAA